MTTTLLPPPAAPDAPEPGPRQPRTRSDFGPLARRIREAGLLDPRPEFYLALTALTVGLLWLTVVLLMNLQGSWWALLLAPLAAVVSAQFSYLGHDIGHHQVIKDRRAEWCAGVVVGNLITGLSYGWWNGKHNKHHASPNVDGEDPDVADAVIAWSDRQAARRTGFGRWFARHQAKFFLPLLTLTGLSLRVAGLRALRERRGWRGVVEGGLLLAHLSLVVGFLVWIGGGGVGGWAFAGTFLVIMNLCFGLVMGMSFAPNHKGMAMPEPGERWDHLRKQVLTSRNLTGSPFLDWWYGGLNHQIEHHLFPSMPRPNLSLAKPIVREYCSEVGLPYHEAGFRQSWQEILGHLDRVA